MPTWLHASSWPAGAGGPCSPASCYPAPLRSPRPGLAPPPSTRPPPLCSHLPAVTHYSTDDLKPCMRQLLALQRAAHLATDYASPYLAGEAAGQTATVWSVLWGNWLVWEVAVPLSVTCCLGARRLGLRPAHAWPRAARCTASGPSLLAHFFPPHPTLLLQCGTSTAPTPGSALPPPRPSTGCPPCCSVACSRRRAAQGRPRRRRRPARVIAVPCTSARADLLPREACSRCGRAK